MTFKDSSLISDELPYYGQDIILSHGQFNNSLSYHLTLNSIRNEGANSPDQDLRVNTSLSALDLAANSIRVREQMHLLRSAE